jgi:hypothetical protein
VTFNSDSTNSSSSIPYGTLSFNVVKLPGGDYTGHGTYYYHNHTHYQASLYISKDGNVGYFDCQELDDPVENLNITGIFIYTL